MLFHSGIGDAGFQQLHIFTAALDGDAGGGQLGDDVTAMLTNIKLHNLFSFQNTGMCLF
jgi:hypothetical protein